MTRRDLLPLGILTAIVTVFFIDVLAGYNVLYLRDLTTYYHPIKHVLRSIVLGGEFPYWNPFIAAGQPLAANPEHEVFYPLTWLILLPGYELGFRLLLVLHVYIAGWTMYAFLRSLDASRAAAFLGALSFALGGLVLSNLTLLPILFVLAWLPLTCLFTRRFLLHRKPRDFAFAALALGLQMLIGEPATIGQTGLLLGAYALARCLRERSVRPLLLVALISIAALLVGAATVLPAADHARDSVRSRGFAYEFVTTWSTPPVRVAELVFSDEKVAHLYNRFTPFYLGIYPGLLITTLFVAGFILRARGAVLTAVILLASWLLALGHHTPLWQWLYDAGLARSVRYPEKFLLMGLFAATAFAARMLDDERVRRIAMYVAGGIVLLALVRWSPTTVLFAALLAILFRNFQHRAAIALVTLFVLLDLGLVFPKLAPRMPAEYFDAPPLARQLPPDRDAWRFMHVIEWQTNDAEFRAFTGGPDVYWMRRNALRPMMPARWGIRTVMEVDYDQTALLPATDFLETAYWLAHARPDWAGVIAPMANARFLGSYDDPRAAFARVKGDPRTVQPVRVEPLGDNPRYFFAQKIVPIRDVREFAEKLLRARSTRGVAYVEQGARPPAGPGVVRGVRETANTIHIEAETGAPAFLVLSVTPHKYWRVTVDGEPASAIAANVGFQGIPIPAAGRHVVELRYRNPLIAIGAVVSAVMVLALSCVAITMRAL
jgi:hypothetical protein